MSVVAPAASGASPGGLPDTPAATGTLSRMAERRYRMLGGLEVLDGTERVELGTRKQRAVLAVLLLEEARVVSVDRLVEAVWEDDPPNRAEASLQSYISTLRRALEPDRGPRAAPSILVTDSGGYALRAARDQVDLWRFADLVDEGRACQAAGDLPGAATKLRNGLAMSAALLPEFAQDAFARHAILRFDALQSAALELSYEVRLALGEHQILIADLEAAVHRYPLHEGLWALLAIARYRVGRQSEALRAIDECRRALADTGVGLSPRLRRLESDLLEQADHLDAPRSTTARPAPIDGRTNADDVPPGRGAPSSDDGVALVDQPNEAPPAAFVGRRPELGTVTQAVEAAGRGGRPVVLVEGEPGSGKTRLLEVATERAIEAGAAVHWGRCTDGAGTPALWPWMQVVTSLLRTLPSDERTERAERGLGDLLAVRPMADSVPGPLPSAGAQHQVFDQVLALVERVAAERTTVLVVDDLQWADPVSLELIEHVLARVPRGVLVVGARRDEAHHDDALAHTLAAMARSGDHRRIHLGPLAADEVAELVALETGREPDAEQAARLRDRTEGNPFYVRELARSLDEPTIAGDESRAVPAGVRDVVRGRMQGLGDATKELLLIAALIGRGVDLGLLARAAALDVEDCLDDLEPAIALGVVVTPRDDPFSVRFSHDLVRESIIETAPPLRTPRLHLRIADALDAPGAPGADRDATVERLAHHLWSAGPLAEPSRTSRALLASARQALARFAYDAAQQRVELSLSLAQSSGDEEAELEALVLITSIVGVRQGYVGAVASQLERAEHLARALGRERLAADLLYSRWASESQGLRLERSGPLAEQLHAQGQASDDLVVRTHGMHARGVDAWDRGRIGESLRALEYWEQFERELVTADDAKIEPLRYELHLLSPVFLAHMCALHGEVERSWALFDRIERTLIDGPYAQMVWGAFQGLTAALVGDPERAVRSCEVCIETDPDLLFEFLGLYIRVEHGWGRVMSGDHDGGLDEMRTYITALDDQSARSGEHAWFTLFGEALLTAGRLDEAAEAFARAERSVEEHGQCYAEPRLLLLQAQLLHARGGSLDEVTTLIDRARVLAGEREAHLFVEQADALAKALAI